ncbi:SWIM zinc finger family protein, partial [Striga asiatica]
MAFLYAPVSTSGVRSSFVLGPFGTYPYSGSCGLVVLNAPSSSPFFEYLFCSVNTEWILDGLQLKLMDIIDSIDNLPVQDPPGEDFSSADLNWAKFRSADRCDDVALIPYDRADAFIIGECSKVECPTRFHIERGRKRASGSLKEVKNDDYLEYRLYWCSFGPENYGEGGGILPSRRYRLNTRNRAARPQSMRGCTCHFVVKRLYSRPSLALLIYNERRHVNKSGFICHGPLDRDAIGPGAKKVPYICNEIQQQTMSLIYLGIPEENVLEKHIEGIQRYGDSNAVAESLATRYVQKLGTIIKHSTHELDLDDQASIRLWVERNKKYVFFYRDSTENEPFVLGIQTEWQLQQMVRFGHRNMIAADSTFGIKRLKHALPVAWIITRSIAKQDVVSWMKALLERVCSVDSGWKVNGFLIDDAAIELDPIRQLCLHVEIFSCPVLFSLWRVRRSWLRHIVKKCTNIEVQREMFKRLGQIVYGIWGGIDIALALDEFSLDFVDQTSFMQYFKDAWVPKLDDTQLDSLQRVDWLVYKLTTELHSSYWLNRYADESDSFLHVKEEYVASTSWHRALQIPDGSVSLDDKDRLFAKVVSQKDGSLTRLVWNAGSEFAHCDCEWSMQGNLCKHVIKVNMVCENLQCCGPVMSYRSFMNVLMDLWRKSMDDSVELDISAAWTCRMLEQIGNFVRLNDSDDIGLVVNDMPLKWADKKARSSLFSRGLSRLVQSSVKRPDKFAARKRSRKRKRISRL